MTCICSSPSHLSPGAAKELEGVIDDGQQVEEVSVIVGETLAEHQAADHVGHCAAQEECGVKGRTCVSGRSAQHVMQPSHMNLFLFEPINNK